MKGRSTASSAGTGTIRGKGRLIGTGTGVATGTSHFSQKGALIGTVTGTSWVGTDQRQVVELDSEITLIVSHESNI